MKNPLLRWPTWAILILLVAGLLVPASFFLRPSSPQKAHAASPATPSLMLAATTVQPAESVNATAVGFTANDMLQLHLDSIAGPNVGLLFCDSTGTCTGAVLVPYRNILAGQHVFLAVGSNNTQAQTTAIVIPTMRVSTSAGSLTGGPGSALHITGAGFTANEAVQVYWGPGTGTFEGKATADVQGNISFPFTAPTNVAPGVYHVRIVRSHQTPVTILAGFTILHPGLTTNRRVQGGLGVYVSVTGFQASELVTVTWTANGGQTIGTFTTDDQGSGQFSSNPVAAPRGAYAVTATGTSSHLSATGTLHVGIDLVLSSNGSLLPGAPVTVAGYGFQSGQTLQVYVQGNRTAAVNVTADASGAFTAQLTLPAWYKIQRNNFYGTLLHLYAVDTQTNMTVDSTSFNMSPIGFGVSATAYGQPMTLQGFGFAANTSLDLYWNYHLPSQESLGSVSTASDGTFTITLPTPSSPAGLPSIPVAAVDHTSKLTALSGTALQAALLLDHPTGVKGTVLHISGGYFAANETVTVAFNGSTIATLSTTKSGAFVMSYVVPAPVGKGITSVTAVGSTSGIALNTPFLYLPQLRITPTSGVPGTTVTLVGQQFASGGVDVSLVDGLGNSTFLGYVNTDPSGSGALVGRITLPTGGLTAGATYTLQALDTIKFLVGQASFVVHAPGAQSLQISQSLTVPGGSEVVTGAGFSPGEVLHVYFQQAGNGSVNATADAQGAFSANLILPVAQFSPKQSYFVFAVSTTSTHHAQAQVLFAFPFVGDGGGGYMQYGYQAPIIFVGNGFAAQEQVRLAWDYGVLGKRSAGAVTAGADGSFSVTLPFPSLPYGFHTLNFTASGVTSGIHAAETGLQYKAGSAQINLSPPSGLAGTQVQIDGGNFADGEQVTVLVNGQILSNGFANALGALHTQYTLPATLAPGPVTFLAKGGSSQQMATATFSVLPLLSISPTGGTTSTSISVGGQAFTPSSTVEITWFDPNTYQTFDLGPVSTTVTGSFSSTMTPPEQLSSGTIYLVIGTDTSSGVSVQASFTAQ